ncbi:MAG: DUF1499 domain-containing protein [Acidobacteria bacterium]|nr:DUF1499 domain-containing protein [Acidobacteriota bacterium]
MKLNTNKMFVYIFIAVCLLPALLFGSRMIWPTINDVRTGQTKEYPDIQPQRFAQARENVFAAALAVAQSFNWEIRLSAPEEGLIEAVDTTPLMKFKDDVTITIGTQGTETVVNVRSKSRVGKGDLGANAKRIRKFQAELAKRLN